MTSHMSRVSQLVYKAVRPLSTGTEYFITVPYDSFSEKTVLRLFNRNNPDCFTKTVRSDQRQQSRLFLKLTLFKTVLVELAGLLLALLSVFELNRTEPRKVFLTVFRNYS